MTTGTRWTVDRIVRVIDGDSLRVIRSRPIDLDGRHYRLTDNDPDGVLLRLAWVDTPERGQPGWHEAGDHLYDWTNELATWPLAVICYESAGWDRILADLTDTTGASASQWLMTERDWPPYTGAKA